VLGDPVIVPHHECFMMRQFANNAGQRCLKQRPGGICVATGLLTGSMRSVEVIVTQHSMSNKLLCNVSLVSWQHFVTTSYDSSQYLKSFQVIQFSLFTFSKCCHFFSVVLSFKFKINTVLEKLTCLKYQCQHLIYSTHYWMLSENVCH